MDFVISARFCEPGGGGDEAKRCRMGIRTVLNIGSPTQPKFTLAPLQDDPLRRWLLAITIGACEPQVLPEVIAGDTERARNII